MDSLTPNFYVEDVIKKWGASDLVVPIGALGGYSDETMVPLEGLGNSHSEEEEEEETSIIDSIKDAKQNVEDTMDSPLVQTAFGRTVPSSNRWCSC